MIQSDYLMIVLLLSHSAAGNDDISNHPAWKMLEAFECGDSASDRIIGGVNAALGQFPWIVRLGYNITGEDEVDWMCGAALLTDRHVVTAAHCVTPANEDYKLAFIRMGEHDDRTDPDCQDQMCAPPVQDRNVGTMRSHPQFNNPAFHNDIAIIELDNPVQLNDYVAPICLPQNIEQLAALTIGDVVTVAGWGTMNMTTQQRANILQVVTLPVVGPEVCSRFGAEFRMASSEICAGAQQNKDTCGGDSGGPLMKLYDTYDGPKHFLVGVVSFGPTVCGIRKPGVYSSVSFFLKWILDNIIM